MENAVPSVTTGGFLVGIFNLRNSKKIACFLQWRDKSKEIHRFRKILPQWITYIRLRRLPARDLVQAIVGECTEEGTQHFRGCFILNTWILSYICSKTAKQYVEVWDGGMEGGICGRESRGKGRS